MESSNSTILVKPKPRDTVLPSGLIIPDTAKKAGREWGVILQGAEHLENSYGEKAKNGMRVYYFTSKNFEKDGEKLVSIKNCILWE